jgi:hypothetical protein
MNTPLRFSGPLNLLPQDVEKKNSFFLQKRRYAEDIALISSVLANAVCLLKFALPSATELDLVSLYGAVLLQVFFSFVS